MSTIFSHLGSFESGFLLISNRRTFIPLTLVVLESIHTYYRLFLKSRLCTSLVHGERFVCADLISGYCNLSRALSCCVVKLLMHVGSSEVSAPRYIFHCPKWSWFLPSVVFILLPVSVPHIVQSTIVSEFYNVFSCLIFYQVHYSFL